MKLQQKKLLMLNLNDLHIIAKGLLEYETLTAAEIKDLLKGKKIKEQDDNAKPEFKQY